MVNLKVIFKILLGRLKINGLKINGLAIRSLQRLFFIKKKEKKIRKVMNGRQKVPTVYAAFRYARPGQDKNL